jgi:hypothetical protein
VGFEIFPFGVGKIGCVAPLHVSERTSSSYLIRFIKQFQKVDSPKFECGRYSGPPYSSKPILIRPP